MTQKWGCDSCPKILDENVMIKIFDELGVIWFWCSECRESYREGKKLGTQPRSPGHYAQLEYGPIVGGIERHVIPFGPPPRRMDILDQRTYL